MQSMTEEVAAVAQNVWSVILGLRLDAASEFAGQGVVGTIQITGAWDGAVTLRCSPRIAARAASILFGVEPAAASPDQVRDVVGELTNVLGGNIKALLPQPSRLSLPAVVEASVVDEPSVVDPATVVARVALACDGDPVVVIVATRGP